MKAKGARKVVGNRGPARSGATSACFGEFRMRNSAPGCIRELSGNVSWSFRSVESNSRSPLSDSFGGTFDFKTGRSSAERKRFAEALVLYCHHAMAEMTESHKASSTLSTNALDVPFFFQCRRMWPLAMKSGQPRSAAP